MVNGSCQNQIAKEFLEVILTTHAVFPSSGTQSPSETNQNLHLPLCSRPCSLSSLSSMTENIKTESIEACFIKIKISSFHQ